MGVEASAYAILGLSPGADRAAIDEAYRRLIKLHHPDRSGGDPERAAEINRAYFELRGKRPAEAREPAASGDLAQAIYARRAARGKMARPPRRRARVWPLVLAAVGLALFLERERAGEALLDAQDAVTGGWRPSVSGAAAPERGPRPASPVEGELSEGPIAAAIGRARRLTATSSDESLASESRECHRQMRADPDVDQLDRCAAFDYAVALLADRDPVQDEGQFSASAVTARQMAAASLVTNDYLAIEGRLDRIRGRVEMALAPAELPPPEPESGGPETAP